MKVLHAPMNFAMQPILIVEELRKKGIDADHIQYGNGKHRFGFRLDKTYNFSDQWQALEDSLKKDYDIYHFWQRSLIFQPDTSFPTGLDLPIIKSRGKRIIHRFTGFDLRLPKEDMQFNPHSPFKHNHEYPFDEERQREYINFLKEYVDQFLVQDPELLQFMPEAKIIPRGLDLNEWKFVGIKKTDCPLVVHAPSNRSCKGSKFILRAVQELQDEGLKFNFKAIENMSHTEAKAMYEKADIIVDQILIGATGVLTLEGWALGKPVVVYLREDLFKPFYGEIPAANANPDNIKEVLSKLIKDYEWRHELSLKGRKAVEQFHNIKDITNQCLELYETLITRDAVRPTNNNDILFIRKRIDSYSTPKAYIKKTKSFIKRGLRKNLAIIKSMSTVRLCTVITKGIFPSFIYKLIRRFYRLASRKYRP